MAERIDCQSPVELWPTVPEPACDHRQHETVDRKDDDARTCANENLVKRQIEHGEHPLPSLESNPARAKQIGAVFQRAPPPPRPNYWNGPGTDSCTAANGP